MRLVLSPRLSKWTRNLSSSVIWRLASGTGSFYRVYRPTLESAGPSARNDDQRDQMVVDLRVARPVAVQQDDMFASLSTFSPVRSLTHLVCLDRWGSRLEAEVANGMLGHG